ncbi:MAG TPA: histidine kinase [Sedimentisphaerales bacterium]|nr:histidine kinase [Sedimentisphaerales bacterium]HRS12774.1 histidine kinase [Sedimentisphaerales bacterium]HRV49384.1 histidine kinase [Sedimentisphaerales bacterium]
MTDRGEQTPGRDAGLGAPLGEVLTQAVLDSLDYPFYVIDACTCQILLVNRAAHRAVVGNELTCYQLTHGRATPCDDGGHMCPRRTVVRTKQPVTVEHIHRDPAGHPQTMEVHAFPVFDDQGRVVRVLEYCVDIGRRRRTERQIRQLNERLEQRVRERTAELGAANERLRLESQRRRRLERDLLEISEREQRRIGQELHDSLGQLLTGIAIMTKALERKLRRQAIAEAGDAKEIARLVNSAVEETRHLSRGLYPVALDENGLMAALESLAEATQNVFRIPCVFSCERAVLVRDASMALHLYRIAQEAVTNAIRHGQTHHIQIELSAPTSRGLLTITSDGRRFEEWPTDHKGIGLQMMRHRAEMINGTLEVQPGPDGGTRVTCAFDTQSRVSEGEMEHGLTDAGQDRPI